MPEVGIGYLACVGSREEARPRTTAHTVLLTNDDGVGSPGIQALAGSLAAAGEDVLVVAPCDDMSGTSASIGRLDPAMPIEVVRVELAGAPGVPAYGIRAAPAVAVLAARLGAFGTPPEVVVSGVNAGLNTGHSILHSGTVGAVLTAQNFGGCGIAVSVEPSEPWHWDTACAFAHVGLAVLRDAPERTVVNINVPARAEAAVDGMRWASLDRFGTVRAAVTPVGEASLQFEYRETGADLDPECDTALVAAGYVTFTALVGIQTVSLHEGLPAMAEVRRDLKVVPPTEAVRDEATTPG
jgi:5'-nucleotidase